MKCIPCELLIYVTYKQNFNAHFDIFLVFTFSGLVISFLFLLFIYCFLVPASGKNGHEAPAGVCGVL